MKNIRFLAVIVLMFSLVSCKETEKRLARSVGGTSEILVVAQNEAQWRGSKGDAVRLFFEQDQYGLPQSEPMFKLANITVDKLSDMFKKHRNLFVIEINTSLKEAVVETKSNIWAKPQRVIKITAPDTQAWIEAFEANKEGFKILFDRTERERLLDIFRPTAKAKVMEAIYTAFGFKLIVPEGYTVAKKSENFMWIRKETDEASQALIIYSIPYRDTFDLSPKRIIKVRDSVLLVNIPGPSDGSFMTTDKTFLTPKINNTTHFVTDFAVETRGLWNVTGDFMAGPFLSYTVIDNKKRRLITLEGYVYSPNKPKRDLLRQLETLLYSFELAQ